MAALRQIGRRWYRIAIFLALSCLAYLYSGRIQEHGGRVLDRLPQIPLLSSQGYKSALVPFVLEPLPLGAIKPLGWLKDQMHLMSEGLPGHEYDFYKFVSQSSWLGGDQEYSALNEAFPYWFNGLVPLAYGLDDERLKTQVHEAAQYVLDHQHKDGWLGPESLPDRLLWARFPLCLGLMQLAQADDTWTQPVLRSLHQFNKLMHRMLSNNGNGYTEQPAGNWSFHMFSWGRVRGQDMMITLQWLLEHDPAAQRRLLLDNMDLLHDLSLKWEDWYTEQAYLGQGMHQDLLGVDNEVTEANFHFAHGVNVAQGLKAAAVIRRFTHDDSLIQSAMNGVNWTMTYHGAASGTILADERLVGLAPYSGSELCTSVELMYSLAYLYQTLGDAYYADLTELAAFNSLPAMLTPDWWAHQYVAVPNQPYAAYLPQQPFYNTNRWAQTFGLEPHYPCCTVNHPQGWPKFLSNSFARVGANGLAHMLLSPGSVRTTLSSGSVIVHADTAYPFSDDILYTVVNEHTFELLIRVPEWAGEQSFFLLNDEHPAPLQPGDSSRLHNIAVPPGHTNISIHLHADTQVQPRANETFAVYRGALLYALELASSNTTTGPRPFKHPDEFYDAADVPEHVQDFEMHSTSTWNVAVDPATLVWREPAFESAADLSNPVFASDSNVGFFVAQACEIHWPMLAQNVPDHPPVGAERQCVAPAFEVKLIPYGCAKLHMADLPAINLAPVV